jgi:tripartite-type tricarboxylate transporter receptor subunit TctC
MKRRLGVFWFAGIFILGLTQGFGIAADYPVRPVTIVNPSAPGGSNDVIGRIFASVAQKYLGQPMVMVNKTGGNGLIATMFCKNAKPDGYTVMTNTGSRNALLALDVAQGKKTSYSWKDFKPLGIVTNSPSMLTVAHDGSWKNVGELVKDMKARPDHFKYCSSGGFGGSHLPMELFMQVTGTTARHVAYHGGGPCIQAAVGGHFNVMTQFPSTTSALVDAKKLKWLATTSAKRQKLYPDIPTLKELGIDAVYTMWIGFFIQKDAPQPIVEKLTDLVYKVAHDKEFVEMVKKVGNEVEYMNPEEMSAYLDDELERFTKAISLILKAEAKKK